MTTAWEIKAYSDGQEILKEVGPMGRFLFAVEERPGLGIDADTIRATLVAAPRLRQALELCVARDLSLKNNVMVMEALAAAGSDIA